MLDFGIFGKFWKARNAVNFGTDVAEDLLDVGNIVLQLQHQVAATFLGHCGLLLDAIDRTNRFLQLLTDSFFHFARAGTRIGNADQYDFKIELWKHFTTHQEQTAGTDQHHDDHQGVDGG